MEGMLDRGVLLIIAMVVVVVVELVAMRSLLTGDSDSGRGQAVRLIGVTLTLFLAMILLLTVPVATEQGKIDPTRGAVLTLYGTLAGFLAGRKE